jgi:FtsH-binding integral membrane protein
MTVGLVVYALKTKTDFTYCGAFFFCIFTVMLASTLMFFLSGRQDMSPIIVALGVSLASLFIIFDVQLIFQGKHQRACKISTEEYIYAAMMLYLDVIRLFLKILELMGKKN